MHSNQHSTSPRVHRRSDAIAARRSGGGDPPRSFRVVALAVALAACGGTSTHATESDPRERTSSNGSEPSVADAPEPEPLADDPVARRCAATHPDQADCPRWRIAMPDACGGGAPEPSFVDPCRCMCDRCGADADCRAGAEGRCVAFSSVLLGGYEERTCVYAGDACHPDRATCDSCRTHAGVVSCADRREIERLRRRDEH